MGGGEKSTRSEQGTLLDEVIYCLLTHLSYSLAFNEAS